MNHVENGKLIKVTPLHAHPTGGALCAKGRAAPELLASPTRLSRPLKRTAPRDAADPGWIEISWDQAMAEIAERLGAIRTRDGAEAVAFAVTTPSGTPMVDSFEWVERFVRCFGSPNLIYAVEVCGWHKDYAHALTFGRGIGVPDWAHTEVVMLWGHNPARTWLAQASNIAAARQRGARVIVIDPKQDGSGQQADLWLRIRPGADGALALGAIRHLIVSQRYDADFVRRWTNAPFLIDTATGLLLRASELWPHDAQAVADDTVERYVVIDTQGIAHPYDTRFPLIDADAVDLHARTALVDRSGKSRQVMTAFAALADEVAPYTTTLVAETCWLDPALVEQFNGSLEGSAERGGVKLSYHAWTGVGQHTNATSTERALGTLYALTGACDAPGGNLWTVAPPTRRVNDYSLLPAKQRAKALGVRELPLGPPSLGWITARDFAGAVLEGTPYPVRALVSFGSNLLVSQSDAARNQQALQALDFHVHIDPFMNPTAQSADIVLPAGLPWEREALKIGFEISQAAVEHIQLRQRMVDPFSETRDDYQIVMELARRMGFGESMFDGNIEAGWNHQLAPLGITVDDLRRAPEGLRFKQDFTFHKYTRAAADGAVAGFATPTRRVELYSEQLLAIGQPPLAHHVEPAESPFRATALTTSAAHPASSTKQGGSRTLPLVLTTAKSGWFVHSSHRQIASLRKKAVDPSVQIGAGLARARGIEAGDWLRVFTSQGQVVMRAKIDDRLDDRTVIAEFGWWQGCSAFGREDMPLVGDRSSNINGILSDRHRDPVSGSVPLRATLCDVIRHESMNHGRWTGLRAFTLAGRHALTGDIVRFDFAPLDAQALPDYLPGQHITVFDAAIGLTRAYSLIGNGRQPGMLSIAVKRDGRMSTHLHGLPLGQAIELGAPNGTFTMPLNDARPVILAANGIGITPFISYLEALAQRSADQPCPDVTLHYVCRDGHNHAFSERIRTLAATLPTVRVVTYYRSPTAHDRLGVDYDRTGDLAFDPDSFASKKPLAYLCGSPRFLAAAEKGLAEQGMPAFDVFSELFTSEVTVPPELLPQTIRIAGTEASFPWHAGIGTLLDAADAAGVSMPSGCRVGQCESCMVRVVSGQVLHLTPYDGPPDQCLTCQAVPLGPVELARG